MQEFRETAPGDLGNISGGFVCQRVDKWCKAQEVSDRYKDQRERSDITIVQDHLSILWMLHNKWGYFHF